MSKIRSNKWLLLAIAAFVTSVVIAQPFSTISPKTSTAKKPPTITPALSPEDFATQVNIKNKKAQQDLFRQAQINLQQQTSQMPLPNSPPKAPRANSSPPTNPPAATPDKNDATNNMQQPAPQSSAPAQATAPNAAQPSDATPAQDQSYTGFSTGTPQQPSSPAPASQSNSGWSIKY